MAEQKDCTTSQLALAWVLAQGAEIFPIPGTKHIKYLEENIGAVSIRFSSKELEEINSIAPKDAASGMRYPEAMMNSVNK